MRPAVELQVQLVVFAQPASHAASAVARDAEALEWLDSRLEQHPAQEKQADSPLAVQLPELGVVAAWRVRRRLVWLVELPEVEERVQQPVQQA